MCDMPLVGVLVEVHDDYVMHGHCGADNKPDGNIIRGTRTNRPLVSKADVLT